jgi:hypothetical protein
MRDILAYVWAGFKSRKHIRVFVATDYLTMLFQLHN